MSEIIERTESLCPRCLRKIPASIAREGDEVYMEKECPEHGSFSTLIWRGADSWIRWDRLNDWEPESYETCDFSTQVERGCPFDCGLCPEHLRQACIVVMEVTNRCNLSCPICFADSGQHIFEPDMEDCEVMFQTVLDRACKHSTPAVQLSGGEPTVRDDLPEIVARGREYGLDYIMINTNGLRIANDREYLRRLKESGAQVIYLQFDGVFDHVYRGIRGRDLMDIKERALHNCAEEGMSVVLVPLIIEGVNTDQIGPIIEHAKRWMPTVRGVHFQPISYFGRFPGDLESKKRVTIPDMLREIEDQTGGEVPANSFVPIRLGLGCEAHCSFTNLCVMDMNHRLVPISYFPSEEESETLLQGRAEVDGPRHSREQIKEYWRLADAESAETCSCSWTYAKFMDPQSLKRSYLSISGMPFQDAMNIDVRRLRKCCVQVVTHDGRLIPFCAFNVTDNQGRSLYRDQVMNDFLEGKELKPIGKREVE